VFGTKYENKLEQQNLGSTIFLFSDNVAVYNNVERYVRGVQATDAAQKWCDVHAG
jgi:hypothetical protein